MTINDPASVIYNALVTDLDGTAVPISSNGNDIDDATKQAIQTALDMGKKITCATGREWEVAKDVIWQLGLRSPCIVEGGTRIVDPSTGKTLWQKSLTGGVPAQVLKILKAESDLGLITHSEDLRRIPLPSVQEVPHNLRFLYLIAAPEEAAVRISNRINSSPDVVAHFTPSWEGQGLVDIHVTHPEATKEHAIQVWQSMVGTTSKETIGMGDSGNDLPIFMSAGFRVAVGNATENLKEIADYIAPRVEEHALKHVIDKFLLGKTKSPKV